VCRTFRGAYTAAHTGCGGNFSLAININERRVIRTRPDAGHTGNTFLLIDARYLPANFQLGLGKDGRRPGGCRSCLRDILIGQLGRMGQAAKENAFSGELDRPQFKVSLAIEAVGIQRYLEHICQLTVILRGIDTGAEHNGISLDLYRLRKVRTLQCNQIVTTGNNRRVFFFVSHKDNAGFTGLFIVFFAESIGTDIAVEDNDVRIGILFLQFEGILYRH
jgi:hypothetical protein